MDIEKIYIEQLHVNITVNQVVDPEQFEEELEVLLEDDEDEDYPEEAAEAEANYWDAMVDAAAKELAAEDTEAPELAIGDIVKHTGRGKPDPRYGYKGSYGVSLVGKIGRIVDFHGEWGPLVQWFDWEDGHEGNEGRRTNFNHWYVYADNLVKVG